MSKRRLRREINLRRAPGSEDASIQDALCDLPEFAHAEVILTYLGFGSEVPTARIVERAWALGKLVALPRCGAEPRQMCWHAVYDWENLVRSPFGMSEPNPALHALLSPDALNTHTTLVVVPGLCFDEQGYRLGYGGGYYDEFLRNSCATSVGLCRDGELFRSLASKGAVEPHDQKVDIVLTQTRCLRLR